MSMNGIIEKYLTEFKTRFPLCTIRKYWDDDDDRYVINCYSDEGNWLSSFSLYSDATKMQLEEALVIGLERFKKLMGYDVDGYTKVDLSAYLVNPSFGVF